MSTDSLVGFCLWPGCLLKIICGEVFIAFLAVQSHGFTTAPYNQTIIPVDSIDCAVKTKYVYFLCAPSASSGRPSTINDN